MTLLYALNKLPLAGAVTVSIWSEDWETELERETAELTPGETDIEYGRLAVLAFCYKAMPRVTRIFEGAGAVVIECVAKV